MSGLNDDLEDVMLKDQDATPDVPNGTSAPVTAGANLRVGGRKLFLSEDVQHTTVNANPDIKPTDLFSGVIEARKVPDLSGDFAVVDESLKRAVEIRDVKYEIEKTYTVSRDRALVLEQLTPGFINNERKLGYFTSEPTKTMVSETVSSLNTELDKNITSITDSINKLREATHAISSNFGTQLTTLVESFNAQGSEALSKINLACKAKSSFRFNSGARLSNIWSQSVFRPELDVFGVPSRMYDTGTDKFDFNYPLRRLVDTIVKGGGGNNIVFGTSNMTVAYDDDDGELYLATSPVEMNYDAPVSIGEFSSIVFSGGFTKLAKTANGIISLCVETTEPRTPSSDSEETTQDVLDTLSEELLRVSNAYSAACIVETSISDFINLSQLVIKLLNALIERVESVTDNGVEPELALESLKQKLEPMFLQWKI